MPARADGRRRDDRRRGRPRSARLRRVVKLAVVVQRYGADINGGAELHARYIAERLAKYAQVEVVTTCARDYVTWRNELPAGVETGQRHRRAAVSGRRERHPLEFGRRSQRVFERGALDRRRARVARQRRPGEPRAGRLPRAAGETFDYVLFFSYRYYHAWHGARAAGAQGDPGADGRTRSGDRAGDLRPGVPRRRAASCTTRTKSAR